MAWYFFKRFLFSTHAGSLTRTISRLCIVGVAVAITAMIVILTVMSGFGEHIEARLLAYEPHLIIKSLKDTPNNKLVELKQTLSDLEKMPGIKSHLLDQQEVIVRNVDGLYSGGIAQGLESESISKLVETARRQANVAYNNWSTNDTSETKDEPLKTNEAIIGADLAHAIGAYPGDRIVITPPETLLLPAGEIPPYLTLTVRNVIRTNVVEIDSQNIFYNKNTNAKLFKESVGFETMIELFCDDIGKIDELQTKLQSKGLFVQSWKQRNSTLFYSLKMEKILIGFFLSLALFIGSFSILTVLVLLATQKRQDIGILKTMGLTAREVQTIFTKIGFMLSGIGVFGGVCFSLLICFALDKFPIIKLPDVYYDRTLPIKYDLNTYVWVLIITFFVTLLSSWLPARWSARMSPTEALRKR